MARNSKYNFSVDDIFYLIGETTSCSASAVLFPNFSHFGNSYLKMKLHRRVLNLMFRSIVAERLIPNKEMETPLIPLLFIAASLCSPLPDPSDGRCVRSYVHSVRSSTVLVLAMHTLRVREWTRAPTNERKNKRRCFHSIPGAPLLHLFGFIQTRRKKETKKGGGK